VIEVDVLLVLDEALFALRQTLGDLLGEALLPRRMSVPRPAMFVAMVTAPRRPAWATYSASCA
jgi:hypothetical protein